MQIKKEMNDDVEQHVTAPSWQCHKLTVLVALARGCTRTLGDAWRLWPHHSLYSAPQPLQCPTASHSGGRAQRPNGRLWCGHEAQLKSPTARPTNLY